MAQDVARNADLCTLEEHVGDVEDGSAPSLALELGCAEVSGSPGRGTAQCVEAPSETGMCDIEVGGWL